MGGMMSANRNRSVLGVDNPIDSDGFWHHRRFGGNRRTGSPTGGRGWRRTIRAKESAAVARDIRSER